MENNNMKKCPYCAEMIREEAIKCRYCSANFDEPSAGKDDSSETYRVPREHWHRVYNGKRIGGVCTGLANEFNAPQLILPLRIFFIVTTFMSGFGFIFYSVLWLLMPNPIDAPVRVHTGSGSSHSENNIQKSGNFLSVIFLLGGVAFVLLALSRSPFMRGFQHTITWPFHSIINLFHFHPAHINDDSSMILGLFALFILLVVIVLFLGALKFFRVVLGCGLIAVGSILLLLFIPFIPGLLLFPGLLFLGMIFFLIGLIKLLMG